MKRWSRRLGLLLGALATVFFVSYAARVLKGQDMSRYLTINAVAGILTASVGYSLIIPMSSLAWRRLLSDLGVRRSWGELTMIMSVTQLAKYIPGNVGQHIGRATMSIGRGIAPCPYGISVLVETALAIIAAIICGVTACELSGMGSHVLGQLKLGWLPVVAIASCAILLTIALTRRWLPKLFHRWLPLISAQAESRLGFLRKNTILYALVVYIMNYIVFGTGITIMVSLLCLVQHVSWLALTGCFALAWVVGFFAPGAPAGLGVREGILLVLLQFSFARADALFVVIAIRLATTIGDILCFAAGSAALFLTTGAFARAYSHPDADHET